MFLLFLLSVEAQHAPLQTATWQTAVQRRAQFADSDFVFDLNTAPHELGNGGGFVRRAFGSTFPALQGQGIGYSLFSIEPCGINLPHVHPRATELLFVINGTGPLRTWLVEENQGLPHSRDIVNDLAAGQVTFFPQGLIHFQQNLGCDTLTFLSALNSEDPGVNTVTLRLFDAEGDEALAQSLGLAVNQVAAIRAGVPAGPAKGLQECLQKCKPTYGGGGYGNNQGGYGKLIEGEGTKLMVTNLKDRVFGK